MSILEEKYSLWGIEWDSSIDEINLIIEDGFYINENDEESMFYNNQSNEKVLIGQILIEIGNLFCSIESNEKNKELFRGYQKEYKTPCKEFVMKYYTDLINMGCSGLVAHALVDYLILFFKEGDTFQTAYTDNKFSIDEIEYYSINKMFISLGYCEPVKMLYKEYKPYDSVFQSNIIEDDSGKLLQINTNLDICSLLNLDVLHARKNNVVVNQCTNCNKYYIVKNKNNTKRCSTCRNVNYETYADDFGKLYRKAYKTMQTRQNRAYDVNDYYTKYTQPWQEDVKQKMEYYRKNNDLNGFKEYLDKAKKQYKP